MALINHLFANQIDINQSTNQILKQSQLNELEILSAPIEYSIFNQTYRQNTKKALFLKDGTFLDVVSDRWEVLQPEEILEPTLEFIKDSPVLESSQVSIQAIYRRSQQKILTGEIEKQAKIDININACFRNDQLDQALRNLGIIKKNTRYDMDKTLDFSLGINAPYQYGQGYQVYLVANRKICSNGMVQKITALNSTISHVAKQGSLNRLQRALIESLKQRQVILDRHQLMASTPVSKDENLALLLSLFARKQEVREECKNLLIQNQAHEVKKFLSEAQINNETRTAKNVIEILEQGIIGREDCKNTIYEVHNALTEYLNYKGESSNTSSHTMSMISGGKQRDISLFTDLCVNYSTQKAKNRSRVMVSV